MWLANDFRRLCMRSWFERCLLLEAVFFLGAARAALSWLTFRQLVELLELVQGEGTPELNPDRHAVAVKIGWAVRTIALRHFSEESCLVQALAGTAMLRWRAIPCTLSLGVAKDLTAIIAHAWLRCGDAILTGANGRECFTVISAFGPPSGKVQSAPAATIHDDRQKRMARQQ